MFAGQPNWFNPLPVWFSLCFTSRVHVVKYFVSGLFAVLEICMKKLNILACFVDEKFKYFTASLFLRLVDFQQAMLHFIYRDEINEDELVDSTSSSESCVSDSLLAKLLAAADQYDLCRLKRMCESRFCKDISVSSVGRILALADANHAMELKAICLKFSSENLAGMLSITFGCY